jgi:hypothetical protein
MNMSAKAYQLRIAKLKNDMEITNEYVSQLASDRLYLPAHLLHASSKKVQAIKTLGRHDLSDKDSNIRYLAFGYERLTTSLAG